MKYRIQLVALILIWQGAFAGNPTSVPLTDPVYAFLDRMETAGVIPNLVDGVKPLDRERISIYLQQIDQQRHLLTVIDRELLDNYLLDYRYEINRQIKYAPMNPARNWYTPLSSWQQFKQDFKRFLQRRQPEEQNHVVLWEDSTNSFSFDFVEEMTYETLLDSVSRSRQSETYRFRGTINENFGYQVNVFMARISGDHAYINDDPVLKNTWRTDRGKEVYFDRSSGEIAWRSAFIDLRIAHQPVRWGLGNSGTLILSDYPEQFAYVNLAKYWKWGGFTFMHGKLLAEDTLRTEQGQPIYPDKWITINRFEFSPLACMAIGLTDIIVYGKRSVEWAYMLPIHYFRAVEHNLRDRDNALLAIDAEVRIIKGMKLYGTWLIDEFREDKLFSNWYGNKHGFQFGMHLVDPFQLNNFEVRFEYVAIMPWVYTHIYNINRYSTDGRSLGYWTGPNSEVTYLNITKWWHRRLVTSLTGQRWRHGANYANKNIGGDIMLGHDTLLGSQTEPVLTRKFLEGILQVENRVQFQTQYEVFNDVYLQLAVNYTTYDNSKSTTRSTELHLGLKFDY
jgi:hypothetical protein